MTNNFHDLFQLLNLPDDGSFVLSDIHCSGSEKSLTISRPPVPTFCPLCHSRMHSKGIYTRSISHPVFQDGSSLLIKLRQRKWRCPHCNHQFNERFPFVDDYKQSTNLTPLLVLDAMKDLQKSARAVARQFQLSDTQVHDIFSSYVDLKRLPLTEFISIDEVYLNIDDSHKYAFVIMDFVSGEIIDIVSNRWRNTLEYYFLSIPLEERSRVKGIISDAYKVYTDFLPQFFPNASSILDSFHVLAFLTQKLNDHLNQMIRTIRDKRKKEWERTHPSTDIYKPSDTREIVLLRNYRWVLLKNERNINRSDQRYWHPMLKMYVDTATIEKMFYDIDPMLRKLQKLKEEYVDFNDSKFQTSQEAATALKFLIQKYWRSKLKIFNEFGNFLNLHIQEIALSFTTVEVSRKTFQEQETYYARLSNGLMESFNRKPKDYKRNARGASNFDYTRNRILWAERKNPSILGIPKSAEEIHSYSLKERTKKKRPKTYKK